MKNTLIILLLLLSSALGATTYYIDPSGNNANNGSSASPWKTLAYACTKATASGDIIHVNAGTYIETSQSLLSVGVSIEGVGVASLIKSDVNSLATILLNSTTEGTNGNQHISGIKMDGDGLKGYIPVMVIRRSNVSIHDCTFIDFSHDGVSFYGDSWGSDSEPATYAANNSIYNNIITNCAGYSSGCCGYGDLRIDGQQDILIHDNVITQTARAAGSNGCGIKPDFTKGMKIYNNTITTDQRVGYESANSYNFSIELWNGHGTEIYNNNLYGTIDLGGHYEDKGAYEYGVSIHNNFIGSTYPTSVYLMAIDLEPDVSCDEIRIYSNQIKNVNQGINFLPTASAKYSNVKVYYNVFDQIGHNESSWGSSPAYAFSAGGGTASSITNFFFYNNVFNMSTYSGSLQANAIEIPCKSGVAVSYFYIQNNIMVGCDAPAIETKTSGTVDHLWITNNIFYGNANSNDPLMHVTPTNYTNANNIKASPAFVSASDFHLQAGSPAIGKGLTVTGMMTADCGGNALNNPPSIGAYESGSAAAPSTTPVIQSSIIQNAAPSVIELTYNLSLSTTYVPGVSAYSVLVNAVARPVSSVSISGTKILLTLSTAVKYGDIITVTYTKPATNPVQTTSAGIAASISAMATTNNLTSSTKDASLVTITMTITPNNVHKTINITLAYAGPVATQTAALTPEIIEILDTSGKLVFQKLITTGATTASFPVNLRWGIYNVVVLANGVQMATQKIRVY